MFQSRTAATLGSLAVFCPTGPVARLIPDAERERIRSEQATKTKILESRCNESRPRFRRPCQSQPFVFSIACRRSPSITSVSLLATIVLRPISGRRGASPSSKIDRGETHQTRTASGQSGRWRAGHTSGDTHPRGRSDKPYASRDLRRGLARRLPSQPLISIPASGSWPPPCLDYARTTRAAGSCCRLARFRNLREKLGTGKFGRE
jgi:hypothetical protein